MQFIFRRSLKVTMFVPVVLFLVNIYLILQYKYQATDAALLSTVDTFYVARYIDQQNQSVHHDIKLQQPMVNTHRVRHVTAQCAKYANDKQFWAQKMTGNVMATPDLSLIYCDVPKVGCTYWKRVFRYLTHDYEGTVSGPEEIPRVYTHFGPWTNTKVIHLSEKENVDAINRLGLKFMISRDPYARLWSAYLDKLYLPDFWGWFGTTIIKKTRRNAYTMSAQCGNDVTFSEFLQVIVSQLKSGEEVDHHFVPSYRRCNPCKIHFDIIGKMETFSADLKYILSYTNINQGHVANESKDNVDEGGDDRALEEMKTLTIYNFDIQSRLTDLGTKNDACFNQAEIAHRIWKTFQYNGYLGDDLAFPYEEIHNLQDKDLIKQRILEKLISIRRNTPNDVLWSWTQQREVYLKEAYSKIPRSLQEGVRDAFVKDFELFQYEKQPSYIFKR